MFKALGSILLNLNEVQAIAPDSVYGSLQYAIYLRNRQEPIVIRKESPEGAAFREWIDAEKQAEN